MAIKIRHLDMYFAAPRFASDCRRVMAIENYTQLEVATVSGVSETTVTGICSGLNRNPEMKTFLGICNALDLNPLNYFDLEEV
jgi:transcriptional regulator with XRE-family HTH domain